MSLAAVSFSLHYIYKPDKFFLQKMLILLSNYGMIIVFAI